MKLTRKDKHYIEKIRKKVRSLTIDLAWLEDKLESEE